MSLSGTKSSTRLELLLFRLNTHQLFGINVLKVKEIIDCPRLTQIPHASATVIGVAELRGRTLPVLDLAMAIGRAPIHTERSPEQKVIIAEFSRQTQGFLVSGVDKIIVRDWKEVLPPPSGLAGGYITGVIRTDEGLVQLVDVERVISQVSDRDTGSADIDVDQELIDQMRGRDILVVDDSSVARNQTCKVLDQLGLSHITARDGKEALEMIETLTHDVEKVTDTLPLVISDIEMPEMDGYQLTREIRANPRYKDIYVMLHTSLDGTVNAEHAAAAGANETLTKFIPELLSEKIIEGLKHIAA